MYPLEDDRCLDGGTTGIRGASQEGGGGGEAEQAEVVVAPGLEQPVT